jgi:hypothetical protein
MPASTGKVSVTYGGFSDSDALFVGQTVASIRSARKDEWNIPADSRAYKGKEQLDETYVVRAGDVIEFHRRMGEKG